ncbi:class I SAM-dependent methyltransferase [Streptomyces synnematoformans]|uniref:Methyltransferase domain-containing protein n=1 Tax=Streptomyces synnematoformans TaxID=415721 RepID=A0ABP5KA85_9ACTN
MGEDLSAAAARGWAVRWELQREQRETGREERFTVVGDLLERVTVGHDRPAALDLGCGTGSLAARLKRRMPALDVVAVDADPVLLGLGRRMHGTRVRFVDAVIGGLGWADALDLERPLDAAVSATMLHRLPERVLLEVYGRLHALLRPGGLLVNAGRLRQDDAAVAELAGEVGRRLAERRRMPGGEDRSSWWEAASAAPELARLFAERRRRGPAPGGENGLSLARHVDLLEKAGFEAVGTVWQCGNSCVLVAVRGG